MQETVQFINSKKYIHCT